MILWYLWNLGLFNVVHHTNYLELDSLQVVDGTGGVHKVYSRGLYIA